ncbi:hypothetical protein JCM8547_006089 [Rhodosporidiobolus lusitaniae]
MSSSHGRHRSSADLYASVPTSDSSTTYPPPHPSAAGIRTITPHTPSPDLTPPSFSSPSHLHTRSESQQTFASEYSNPDAPYRLRGGASPAAGSAMWGDSEAGHDYSVGGDSPSLMGSSANLNAMAYRNVAGGQRAGDSAYGDGKEGSYGGAGAVGAGAAGRRGGKGGWWSSKSSRAKKMLLAALVLLVLLIAIAIAVPVGITQSNKNNNAEEKRKEDNDGTEKGIPTAANPSTDWSTAPYGGNGSVVYTEDGSSFTYNNSFGGYWVSIPFNDTARPQRDTPRLNETWDYEKHLIQGVNIGGWLVLEPFIVPHMFEPFNADDNSPNATNSAIDEWTLSEQLTAQNNLTNAITEHYETFITEKDFAQIAGAGLNWVRIPIGWWAVETWDGEPFLEGVAWTYFLKAVGWARKYGLRVNLDLHAVPGSQNGYNHSGKLGSINFLNGLMGVANAQRTLDIIRTLTEFISQPEYKNVVPMFSVLNEPYAATIGSDALRSFYIETYEMMRSIGGYGEGNGPFLTFHDGFATLGANVSMGGWNGFLNGWDRVAMDSHRYLCFDQPNNYGLSYQAALPCNYWAENMNSSTNTFGLTMGGEWSLAINDCGKWLNNVGNGARYDGTYYVPNNKTAPAFDAVGNCDQWIDYNTWNQSTKDGLRLVAEGHMDALRHWFFWTWKTGYSGDLGMIANPMWNYQLGLENGWIPTNPRTAMGSCASLVTSNGFSIGYTSLPAPTLQPWMTGGGSSFTYSDSAMYSSYSSFPPASIGAQASTGPYITPASYLPTFTQARAIHTMSAPAQPTSFPSGYASSSVDVGSGWVQSTDSASFYTSDAACTYVDAWSGAAVPIASVTASYCGEAAAQPVETAAVDADDGTDDATATATDDAAVVRRMKRFVRSTPRVTFTPPTPPPRMPVATRARR